MKISVKMPFGDPVSLEVEANETISSVKDKVQSQGSLDIPPDQQRLTFNNEDLKDNKTLADYKIHDGSTIVLEL